MGEDEKNSNSNPFKISRGMHYGALPYISSGGSPGEEIKRRQNDSTFTSTLVKVGFKLPSIKFTLQIAKSSTFSSILYVSTF